MFTRISDRRFLLGAALLTGLAGCTAPSAPDNSALANAEARGNEQAAEDGRIACALEGAVNFDRTCTMDRMTGPNGTVLMVGRDDVGFRRLLVAGDGRGLVAADGAEPAVVAIVGDGLIEVSIGKDRYRFPATIKGDKAG